MPRHRRITPCARRAALTAVAIALVAVSCSSDTGSDVPTLGTISVRTLPPGSTRPPATARPTTTVGGPTTVAPPSPERDATWTSPDLDGAILARPLAVGDLLVVATQNNSLYGLDRASGAVVWGPTTVGPAVGLAHLRSLGATAGCSAPDPIGIAGTPAVDPATGLIYAVATVQTPDDPVPVHQLVTIDGRTGVTAAPARPVDPPGADRSVLQQRAALLLANGSIYIGFAGLEGGCGGDAGWLVAAPLDPALPLRAVAVASGATGPAHGWGIWAPSGPVAGGDGTIYAATGRLPRTPSAPAPARSGGVIAWSPTLEEVGSWAPATWAEDEARGADAGSAGPLLLPGDRIFQLGGQGTGYVLSTTGAPDRLGGVGGEVASVALCAAAGGHAFDAPLIFVACADGIRAVRVDLASAPPTLRTEWRTDEAGGPPVVDGALVWSVNAARSTLVAFVKESGQVVTVVPIGAVDPLATPTVAGERVFVAAGARVLAVDSLG